MRFRVDPDEIRVSIRAYGEPNWWMVTLSQRNDNFHDIVEYGYGAESTVSRALAEAHSRGWPWLNPEGFWNYDHPWHD